MTDEQLRQIRGRATRGNMSAGEAMDLILLLCDVIDNMKKKPARGSESRP